MGSRIIEGAVLLAAVLSAGVLALMVAAPLLPQPSGGTGESAAPSASASLEPSAAPEGPPLGLFLLRGPFSFGPCLALELAPQSYPVAGGAEGTATVLSWERGMTGCDSRSGEIVETEASVTPVTEERDGGARLVGYAIDFDLPQHNVLPPNSPPEATPSTVSAPAHITILTGRSTPVLLQALDTTTQSGFGLVFDRVSSLDPALDPLPSATPVPSS